MPIQSKLIISLFFLGILLCSILYFLMQWSFDRGMIHYVNRVEESNSQGMIEAFENYYRENGTWDQLIINRPEYLRLVRLNRSEGEARPDNAGSAPPRQGRGPGHRPQNDGAGPPRGHRGGPRRPIPSLLDANKKVLIGQRNSKDLSFKITVNGELVGWIAVRAPTYPTDDVNLSLKHNFGVAFYLVALALIFCALFIGVPLSRHIVRPLRSLAEAANMLTRGDYKISLPFKRGDEIGKLARDFETLATTLESNEKSRSRWVAGISHELRTPLAIVTGEIDAMLEGVRPLNQQNLNSLKYEIAQLTHLVNDLYELSNAEIGALRYTKSAVNMCDVVHNAAQRFEDLFASKSLSVRLQISDQPCWVSADIQRFDQLLNNLLVNEVKYAQEGASVSLSLHRKNDILFFAVEDSGPGVATEHLDKLFDYIYRVELSRNRKMGGSGLGLAICRNIVEAHDGVIYASHSALGGLKITVELPVVNS